MTNRLLAAAAVLAIAFTPLVASAQRGGGGRGGGAMRAPAPRAPQGGGGFNLNRDVRPPSQPQRPAQQPQRPAQQPQRPAQQPQRNPRNGNNANQVNRNTNNNNVNRNTNNNNVNRNTNNTNVNRNVNNTNVNRNVNNVNVNRTVINNPVYVNNTAWGWNHGVVWSPYPYYWGGGFWGAMAIGVTSAAVYGTIVANNTTYTSYQVQPSSPGATMLSNYQLTQTQCGPPNLVVVYGPDNSVICAMPNSLVAAGNYELNTSTLSLTSM